VSHEGIATNPEMLKAVRELLTPKNKHEIRSFLGYALIADVLVPVSPTLRNR
jgi:hypothetical protein